jgi:peptide-methionine (R)-S-oxide reductase
MTKTQADTRSDKIAKSDTEWRTQLTPRAVLCTRQHGTERAGTSPLNKEKRAGTYSCVCCGEPLFKSDAKFDAGTGLAELRQARPTRRSSSARRGPRAVHASAPSARRRAARPTSATSSRTARGQTTGLRYCINGAA